ncbi:NAD(P)/FAD-dependent oxidoreductase [Rhizohabitans arisaemae]|uniref:NAD(P)/FAD-dependent oxidoreductase n=1 Tax=Rhizohabitans arisaemae TaxID=2720610 RepID=UPI0024B1A8D3|nr:FAD-binding oxidoreductase [Rhizohabitans arisaemae]
MARVTGTAPRRNGEVSFWWSSIGRDAPRESLRGSLDADVVIVGGGYTGLWTAYYLAEADPSLRVVVLESRFAGFGASGRNGGWLTSAIAGSRSRYAAAHGRQAVVDLQREMIHTVDEVLARLAAEGVDADAVKGGVLSVARNRAQWERTVAAHAEETAWGDPDATLLDRDASLARIAIADTRGALFSPHTARINPVKLVRGLAAAAERRGVVLLEDSEVVSVAPGRVRTAAGAVEAPVVLRCTEGFTAALPGLRRSWLPMNSSLLVTEPLGPELWEEIGWDGCETLGDMAHAYMYAQRTADGRIALGGRGVPYRYGSRTDADGDTPPLTIRQLHTVLTSMFPMLRDVGIDHVWSGVLGVPRDWCAQMNFDPTTGLGHAGGYVGHGVATANLAGRTLRDLVLGRDTSITTLPHVNWAGRNWEPEPLRWLGVQAMYAAYRTADRRESRSGSGTSVIARIADKVSGRH